MTPRSAPTLQQAPEPAISLVELLRILWRRRLLIILIMALITAPSILIGLWKEPRYTATASVLIQPNLSGGVVPSVATIIDTQRDIIRSRTLVQEVMEDLHLYDHPDYRVEPDGAGVPLARLVALMSKSSPADAPAAQATPQQSPKDAAALAEDRAHNMAAASFVEELAVEKSGDSYVFKISFTAKEPDLAAAVANHVAVLYIERQATEKEEAAERREAWLTERLAAQRNDMLATELRLAQLRAKYQFIADKAVARSEGGVLLQDLQQQAEVKREAYQALVARFYDTRDSTDSISPDARIIARSQPPTEPSSTSPALIAVVSLTISGVLGALAALLREQTDYRLRSRRQVEESLGVRCLALLPATPKRAPLYKLVKQQPQSAPAQAVRATLLRALAAEPTARVILVTSALPGEGKTQLATALAACSDTDRTLLLDLNLWHPGVARLIGLSEPADGTASLLTSPADPAVINGGVQRDGATGIDVLPAGKSEYAALSESAVLKLLEILRARYDRIIIDGPQLIGVADTSILARSADAVLLAARWGKNDIETVGTALRALEAVSARVLGVVLTRVHVARHARYGERDDLIYRSRLRRRYAT